MNTRQFELILDYLGEYFEEVRARLRSPKSVLIAVEMLLQNSKVCEQQSFSVIRGQLPNAGELLDAYQDSALEYFRENADKLWKFEGEMMRRWSMGRKMPIEYQELWWIEFLRQYTGVTENLVQQLLRETNKECAVADPYSPVSDRFAMTNQQIVGVTLQRVVERLSLFC